MGLTLEGKDQQMKGPDPKSHSIHSTDAAQPTELRQHCVLLLIKRQCWEIIQDLAAESMENLGGSERNEFLNYFFVSSQC